MSQAASQQGPHSLGEAFDDFLQSYPRETAYPIFGLLKCVALCFPVVESQDAVNAFVWIVGKHQTETVAKERAAIAKRNQSAERLRLPVVRALRQARDFYFEDVRKNPNDNVAQRIPRWGKEVQTLPVYQGKIDTPHPVTLAWEYESLKGLCSLVEEEEGFSGWAEFAKESGGHGGLINFPLWPDGTVAIIGHIPEDATADQVALAFLSTRADLSVERLRKLIYQGNRFFPEELSAMLQNRCKVVFEAEDKPQDIQTPRLDQELSHVEFLEQFDLAKAESFGGFQIASLLPAGLTIKQLDAFSRLLKSKK